MKELSTLPGYEAQLLPTLKDTIDRMTDKSTKRQQSQHHDLQGKTGRRASMGFAGIGAGATNLIGARENAGLGMGSVGMAAGSKVVTEAVSNESGNEGRPFNLVRNCGEYIPTT